MNNTGTSVREDRIKTAARIEDVVGEFVELRRSGARYLGLCPFHDDTHVGSFSVYPAKNVCKCFACGAGYDPVGFLMNYGGGMKYREALRWIADRYGLPAYGLDGAEVVRPMRLERHERPVAEALRMSPGMVEARIGGYDGNPLVRWMYSLPWSVLQRACVSYWLRLYKVGTSTAPSTLGWTIWWTLDGNGGALSGKLMKYGADGHRVKEGYCIDHVHSVLKRAGRLDMGDREVRPCLFGLHLVGQFPDRRVCVVESEKTAVLMQVYNVEEDNRCLFLATGGKNRLTREMLEPVARTGRDIILYPDMDGLEEWQRAADALGYDCLTVSRNVRRAFDPEKDGAHADIADIMVRRLREHAAAEKQARE